MLSHSVFERRTKRFTKAHRLFNSIRSFLFIYFILPNVISWQVRHIDFHALRAPGESVGKKSLEKKFQFSSSFCHIARLPSLYIQRLWKQVKQFGRLIPFLCLLLLLLLLLNIEWIASDCFLPTLTSYYFSLLASSMISSCEYRQR